MTTENEKMAKAAAEAPAKLASTTAETVATVAKESAQVAKRARTAAKRSARRNSTVRAVKAKAATRRTVRKTRTAVRKTAAAAQKRTQTVTKTNNFFNGFEAAPAFAPFQSLLNDANERSQEMVKRSQKVAEELGNLARANVEAVVEASRVAAQGARTLGQDAAGTTRDGFEKAADAIRSFAEAKSPTEYLQLQSEFARASFDRMVAESSRLTETMVKLAGEAFQPLSNRASANAERFNTLVA